jgi:hypothetical protein
MCQQSVGHWLQSDVGMFLPGHPGLTTDPVPKGELIGVCLIGVCHRILPGKSSGTVRERGKRRK